jgi:hypothetical protein
LILAQVLLLSLRFAKLDIDALLVLLSTKVLNVWLVLSNLKLVVTLVYNVQLDNSVLLMQ